jgi:hypothetical protein
MTILSEGQSKRTILSENSSEQFKRTTIPERERFGLTAKC